MDEKARLRALSGRLTNIRADILRSHVFLGRLLLHLKTRFANCGTACTDMSCIAFDPDFAEKLTDREIRFVYLHELMHCVLHHCIRAKGKQRFLYNVACDIVVNSLLMETMQCTGFRVDGEEVMHLAPNGREGREYSAEEVYRMLLHTPSDKLDQLYGNGIMDTHDLWELLKDPNGLGDSWSRNVREASKNAGTGSGIPSGLRRHLKEVAHDPKTNWRQLLHDYIQFDRSDYTYSVPDRRYDEFIMPSFQEDVYGSRVDRVWVLIDTSGSVRDEDLSAAYHEIRDAMAQVQTMTGVLSFFDSQVSEHEVFGSEEDLLDMKPVGGGGTSFYAIFRYLREHMTDPLPRLILILTDGYAQFPPEEDALGVDVIWVIMDSPVEPPWGSCVHIETQGGI